MSNQTEQSGIKILAIIVTIAIIVFSFAIGARSNNNESVKLYSDGGSFYAYNEQTREYQNFTTGLYCKGNKDLGEERVCVYLD